MTHTVLVFKKVEFRGEWSRSGRSWYRAADEAKMLVVVEGATGVKETYSFVVTSAEEVFISMETNAVHIPAGCVNKSRGDQLECGRDG